MLSGAFHIAADIELPTVESPAALPVTTAEIFGGRRSLLVSVPGAFTTICDAVHLPGFVQRAGAAMGRRAIQTPLSIFCMENHIW
jgi:peroxiredoxin